jgi:hypothetical protein
LLILTKARARKSPATGMIRIIAINLIGTKVHIIKVKPAAPKIYPNCLRVRGPIILSSISINCGTRNCIYLSIRWNVEREKSLSYFNND